MRLHHARHSPLAAILVLTLASPARPESADPDIPALRALELRLRAEYAAAHTTASLSLLRSADPLAATLRADRDLLFVRLDARGAPFYYALDNVNAAATIGTNTVQPGGVRGLGLDGSGTPLGQLGLWDGGAVRVTHAEFGGRAIQLDAAVTTSPHSTHVAGTMIAAGVDPAAHGMAPAATLDCYDWDADLAEMAAAAAAGMRVSNHSYSATAGWRMSQGQWYWHGDPAISETEDYGFGFYGTDAQAVDELAYDAPGYLIVVSAGNNRADYGPGSGGEHAIWDGDKWVPSTVTRDPDGGLSGYDSLPWSKSAKNPLVVGAVNDLPGGWSDAAGVAMTWFSGFGPTDDGRIKPDLVANGVSLWSCTDSHDSSHAFSTGTSMSTPSVAGSANLLVDHWRSLHGSDPRAATLKALLFQTADEAGADPGPDYRFGWGLMNTGAAASLISTDAADTLGAYVIETELAEPESRTFTFVLADTTDARFTLHWTDVPGSPPAPALDPIDAMLVNDLDLRLTDGSSTWEPWILDPANPSSPATTGDNFRDNTEQIVTAPLAPGSYTLTVSHKGSLVDGPQAFSLVASLPIVATPSAVTAGPGAAGSPLLAAAAPNPFARGTALSFRLPDASPVRIDVFDVRGRFVRTLAGGTVLPAGPQRVEWDGRYADGTPVASGVYFVRIAAGSRLQMEKLVRVRPR